MNALKPLTYSLPLFENKNITILGAGNVTKSLLLTASLLRPNIKFRVIARSSRSAELIREYLNDLPRLQVEVVTFNEVPDLTNELVVLTIGERTAKFSKKTKKESLQQKNQSLISGLLSQLKSATVIVVTNPSTAITRFLTENGIQAYGVGVANDQLRFNNQAGDNLNNHYFVGGHNFHDLTLGSKHSKIRNNFPFSHEDYKDILRKQDKKVVSLKNMPFSVLDYNWDELERTNAAFPPEYRWYARQRIHSKFHDTTISCALAILNTICFFTKKEPVYNNFSLEMPLYLDGSKRDTVLGWPIDGATMQPLELTFDDPEYQKLLKTSKKYEVNQPDDKNPIFYLTSPFGDTVALTGNPAVVHNFYRERLFPLFSISSTIGKNKKLLTQIVLSESRRHIEEAAIGQNDEDWKSVPQHRGKNPQEFTDLQILHLRDNRIVKFPDGNAIGLFDEVNKKIELYFSQTQTLHHELRRLIRDEIGIPCLISRGARVLHAGVVQVNEISILILGESGGGKTTAILSLLCADLNTNYGSSERTMVWISNNNISAIGIPESITVFPGTLSQIAEFKGLAKNINVSDAWDQKNKIRLQQSDIIQISNCNAITRETKIDLIIEVGFDKNMGAATSELVNHSNEKKALFFRNDITEMDPVRISWLDWFPKTYNKELYNFLKSDQMPEVHSVKWGNQNALRETLINIIARKKLNNSSYGVAKILV